MNTNVLTSSNNNSGTSRRHLNCKNYSENTSYEKNTRNHGDRCQYVNNDDDSEHVWLTSKSSSMSDLREAVINTNYTTASSKNNDANEDEDEIEVSRNFSYQNNLHHQYQNHYPHYLYQMLYRHQDNCPQ